MKKIFLVLFILTVQKCFAQSGWFWLNPKPQGTNLYDVKYLNSNILIAVGEGGTVLKSTDGGVNWTSKNIIPVSDTQQNVLLNIYVFNESNFILLSRTDRNFSQYSIYNVFKTSDGGNSFVKYFADSVYYQDYKQEKIFFTDNNTGWITNFYSPDGAVYRTTNGGVNWYAYSINGSTALQGAVFMNQNTGLIGDLNGTNYYRTTNGGANWTYLYVGYDYRMPFFINENTGWLSAGIYKTTNGGLNFTVNSPGYEDNVKSFGFINENTGWCIFSNLGLYRSTNSGVNWISQSQPNLDLRQLNSAVINSTSGIAVGANGRTFLSSNNGINWSANSSSVVKYQPLSSVHFLNENTGWVLSNKFLLNTTNGGTTWTNKDTTANYESIKFVNENTGIFTMENLYAVTTNGGTNWTPYQYAGYEFSSINITSPSIWYVYGKNIQTSLQLLMKTTDAGGTWITKSCPPNSSYSLKFVNDNTGFFTGSYGTYKTTNGGTNWINMSDVSCYKSFFLNENTGWSYGNGLVMKSTNSGVTWVTQYSNNAFIFIYDLYFANSLTGFFAGSYSGEGLMMKTTDGGNTWLNNSNLVTDIIRAFSFVNANTGLAVGANGTILKTISGGVGIQQISASLPDKFYLEQNYPNPFNPNTNIEFSLPQNTFVKLKVFDLLGRVVANLVNEDLSAGSYKYDFNASLLPSGIYFYKLETDNFSETRKMVLLK